MHWKFIENKIIEFDEWWNTAAAMGSMQNRNIVTCMYIYIYIYIYIWKLNKSIRQLFCDSEFHAVHALQTRRTLYRKDKI